MNSSFFSKHLFQPSEKGTVYTINNRCVSLKEVRKEAKEKKEEEEKIEKIDDEHEFKE